MPTLRSLLLAGLGTVGADPQIRTEAARRFDRSGAEPIDPDLEGAVLQSVAAQLRPGDYEAMLERYRNPSTPQEELRYLMALAAFPDVDLALRTFELARTEVRTQNAPYLVASLLGNRVAGRSGVGQGRGGVGLAARAVPREQPQPHARRGAVALRRPGGGRASWRDSWKVTRCAVASGRSPRCWSGSGPTWRSASASGQRSARPCRASPCRNLGSAPLTPPAGPGIPGLPAGLADAGKVPR